MNTKIEDWDESILDVEDYQVERALTNAGLWMPSIGPGSSEQISSSRKMVKPKACGQMRLRLMKSDSLKIWSASTARSLNCKPNSLTRWN